MVEVSIFSSKGYIQKESFEAPDLAHATLLDLLRGKMGDGEMVFAVVEEGSVCSYVFVEDNVFCVLSAEEYFNRFVSQGIQSLVSDRNEFNVLSELLHSEEWPQAVYDAQIANENSEKDKDERAEGIVDILMPPLEGKKFLDFGCGEGHIANYVGRFAEVSVGYDISKNSRSRFDWEIDDGKRLLTTDFKKVESKAPYDVILIYDVLDHAKEFTPQEILSCAKSLLSDGGKIYLRTHPWTSRHGGHAYRKINKAFVHLVFTEGELKSMGIDVEPNLKVTYPLHTYESWISESGLVNSVPPEVDQQEVETFFRDKNVVRERIMKFMEVKEWGEGTPPGRPEWQMSQCFWDFILEKE